MFRALLAGRRQKVLIGVVLVVLAVKLPFLWPVLVVFTLVTAFRRFAPPYLLTTLSWAATGFIAVSVVLLVGGLVVGLLSGFNGLLWRVEVPWGLVWATDGDSVGFEFGNGFTLSPVLAALLVALARLPFAWQLREAR
ncbi:MAG: hypothetical protein ABIS86_04890 [Streptosporangiaceae bacterium]